MARIDIPIQRHLVKAFIDEGLVPPECSAVDLSLSASGAPVLTFKTFVQPEQLPKLARAFAAIAAAVELEQGAALADKIHSVARPQTALPCDDFRAWAADATICGICGWRYSAHNPARAE